MSSHHMAYDRKNTEYVRELTRHLTPSAREALIGQKVPVREQHQIQASAMAAKRREESA